MTETKRIDFTTLIGSHRNSSELQFILEFAEEQQSKSDGLNDQDILTQSLGHLSGVINSMEQQQRSDLVTEINKKLVGLSTKRNSVFTLLDIATNCIQLAISSSSDSNKDSIESEILVYSGIKHRVMTIGTANYPSIFQHSWLIQNGYPLDKLEAFAETSKYVIMHNDMPVGVEYSEAEADYHISELGKSKSDESFVEQLRWVKVK